MVHLSKAIVLVALVAICAVFAAVAKECDVTIPTGYLGPPTEAAKQKACVKACGYRRFKYDKSVEPEVTRSDYNSIYGSAVYLDCCCSY